MSDFEDGVDGDFVEAIARELLDTGLDIVEDIPDSEKDDILLVAFSLAVANLAVGFRVLNPNYSHTQILNQLCDRIKSEYVTKVGIEDTGPSNDLVN